MNKLFQYSFLLVLTCAFILTNTSYAQETNTFVNPVIPGDHPDPTLSKIGNYFYTSGSSFNPTPKIYRSTDLVHWEVIAQPVKASWNGYGDVPGGGAWGGHTVFYNNKYWHYFGRGGNGGTGMYFVSSRSPSSGWSDPVAMNTNLAGLPPFGVDNSIFIDEVTGKWYLLTKAGESNNHIVELGDDGQPTGEVLDLTWLNPEPDLPYGWAEGPVMWHFNGYYYYSFAQHLVGQQFVMRSQTLTDNPDDWEVMQGSMFTGSTGTFDRPNHISPAVLLDDSTSWVIGHSYYQGSFWQAHGRQGLLIQVKYQNGWPIMQYPPAGASTAPNLPNSDDIPWMVPKSDMFRTPRLSPNWAILGYTPDESIDLSARAGWIRLTPHQGSTTILQNDGEHQYTAITRLDFAPESPTDQAGLWIINGPEELTVKLYSSANEAGQPVLGFSFDGTVYDIENTIGSTVWLKLERNDHTASGFYSQDGIDWVQIGEAINISAIDQHQNDFNDFTGNQQGLFVLGKEAYFDSYIYRDAYSDIMAKNPANFNGVSPSTTSLSYLNWISNNDWAMYAGIQFGTKTPSGDAEDYQKFAKQIHVVASNDGEPTTVEVWLDGINSGEKIGEVTITNTVTLSNFETFSAELTEEITDVHDVYLLFKGTENASVLARLQKFYFTQTVFTSLEEEPLTNTPGTFQLMQNYPNPFNPTTNITYQLPEKSFIRLAVFDMLGREVTELEAGVKQAGTYSVTWDATNVASGMYMYRLTAGNEVISRKMLLLK